MTELNVTSFGCLVKALKLTQKPAGGTEECTTAQAQLAQLLMLCLWMVFAFGWISQMSDWDGFEKQALLDGSMELGFDGFEWKMR